MGVSFKETDPFWGHDFLFMDRFINKYSYERRAYESEDEKRRS